MKRILLVINLVLATVFSYAQNDAKILSFDEALIRTMDNNPQIKALQYEEKAAEQERKAAFGLRLPQITAMGTYAHLGSDIDLDFNKLKAPVSGILGELAGTGAVPPAILQQAGQLLGANWGIMIQNRDLGFAAGNVVMPIYMGGKINAANNAAKINERTVDQTGRQSRNALVSELVERYFGLALADQVVAVREQVLNGMRVHLRDAVAMETNGVIAKGERLYVDVKVAEAERELLKARLQRETIASALGNTLGENNNANSYRPVSMMFTLSTIEDISYFKSLAESGNPLLKQVSLKHDLAVQGVKLERSEFLPQIAVMGGGNFYNYQVSKYIPTWGVGVGVKLKIFDGLNREYKYSAAKNKVRQVESVQVKANNDISMLVEKLYNEMRTYHDQITSIDASMAFAVEYLRIKEAAFKEGMAASTDVIDAQLNLAKICTERLQSAYYYDLMLARLLEASGISDQFAEYASRDTAKQVKIEK